MRDLPSRVKQHDKTRRSTQPRRYRQLVALNVSSTLTSEILSETGFVRGP